MFLHFCGIILVQCAFSHTILCQPASTSPSPAHYIHCKVENNKKKQSMFVFFSSPERNSICHFTDCTNYLHVCRQSTGYEFVITMSSGRRLLFFSLSSSFFSENGMVLKKKNIFMLFASEVQLQSSCRDDDCYPVQNLSHLTKHLLPRGCCSTNYIRDVLCFCNAMKIMTRLYIDIFLNHRRTLF